jgi:hypothetical protein
VRIESDTYLREERDVDGGHHAALDELLAPGEDLAEEDYRIGDEVMEKKSGLTHRGPAVARQEELLVAAEEVVDVGLRAEDALELVDVHVDGCRTEDQDGSGRKGLRWVAAGALEGALPIWLSSFMVRLAVIELMIVNFWSVMLLFNQSSRESPETRSGRNRARRSAHERVPVSSLYGQKWQQVRDAPVARRGSPVA